MLTTAETYTPTVKLTKDERQENAIIRRVIRDALAAGYTLDVNDGCETTLRGSRNAHAVFAAMKSTGEDFLIVRSNGQRLGMVRFVYGNCGDEVICDHSDKPGIDAILTGANEMAERYGAAR